MDSAPDAQLSIEIPGEDITIGDEISRGAEGLVLNASYGGQRVCVKVHGRRAIPPRHLGRSRQQHCRLCLSVA